MTDSIDLMDDEVLLRRYAEADDRDALDLLFRRHVNIAYATALRLCRNAADAEDAVQTAFMQVMKHAASYRGGRGEHGVRMWIIRTVANAGKMKIRTEVRRRRREEIVVEDQDDFQIPDSPEGPEADLREKEHEVLAALDQLPDRFRSAIWLHLCQGLSRADAAAALGLPERTLDNQVQYGMKKLRQSLSTMGTSVSLASLTAALPLLTGEPAPVSLVGAVENLAHTSLQTIKSASGAHLAWKWPAIIGGIVAATGLASLTVLQSPKPVAPPTPPPASPAVHHYWDLNTPSLPPELSVLQGKWSYQPGEGVSGSGCLQTRSLIFAVLIDVPMDRLPVVLSYRVSPKPTGNDPAWANSKSFWSEHNSAAEFNGLATALHGSPGAWVPYREYVTEAFIYRWRNAGPYELCAFERAPNARLVLSFTGAQVLIDDIRIESIRAEDIPDVSPYMKALAEIPAVRRKGIIPLPQFKPGRPEVKQVTVRFDGHFSFLEWAKKNGN